jgi:hypothetical protein
MVLPSPQFGSVEICGIEAEANGFLILQHSCAGDGRDESLPKLQQVTNRGVDLFLQGFSFHPVTS